MSASRIVLLRHGQTDFNLARRFQGRIDQPLNEAGRSQAAGAAGVLVSRLCEPSAEVGMIAAEDGRSYDDGGVRIVSSPLGRAVDTARIIARVFDIAGYPCEGPEFDERLTERFYGSFEGKTYEEIASEQPEAYAQYRAQGECDLAEVERSEVVGERVRDAVLEAARLCRGDQSLIVVSHGAAIARGIVRCWASIRRSLMGCAELITATGQSSCPWGCRPPRARRSVGGAWRRTTSALVRIFWGRDGSRAPRHRRISNSSSAVMRGTRLDLRLS